MELERVGSQPPSPDEVVRKAAGDDTPETWPVAEDPQMRKLVDDDRFEGLGWGEDEAPREAQPALAGGAPPATTLVADRDGGRPDAVAGGTVTMSPSVGWIVTRRLRDRAERRRMYGGSGAG